LLSRLFTTLRKYETRFDSTPLAHRAARKEQLAAARRELEGVAAYIVSMPRFVDPKVEERDDQEPATLETMKTAAFRTMADAEEMSEDERRLRFYEQQADELDITLSPAHPHIQACWTEAAECLRKSKEAAAVEEGINGHSVFDRDSPSNQLLNRSHNMVMLAEGAFADAAHFYRRERELMQQKSTGCTSLTARYCREAADAFVKAGVAAVEDGGVLDDDESDEGHPAPAAQFEKLARQCVRAMSLHEHNPSPSSEEVELLSLAVDVRLAFMRQGDASITDKPVLVVWTAADVDQVCELLNEACHLRGLLRDTPCESDDAAALQQRAQWYISVALTCGRTGLKQLSAFVQSYPELRLLRQAMLSAKFVRCFFEDPRSVEEMHTPYTESMPTTCMHHQTSCERILLALRACQQGRTVERQLWESAAVRWRRPPVFGRERSGESARDSELRCIADHLAQRAVQLMKRGDDADEIGELALYYVPTQDLGPLAPSLPRIRTFTRAIKDNRLHEELAGRQKKRSPLWMLHTRASVQFQNAADYESRLMDDEVNSRRRDGGVILRASLASQSAQYFAYATELTTALAISSTKEDIIALYTMAGDLLETNPYDKEQSVRMGTALSTADALRVAEKAGKRFGAAARAMAQGDRALRDAWKAAADATSLLVMDLEAKKANKRRTRVLTEAYTPEALALADALAAAAAAMKEEHRTVTDLCSDAEEEQEDGQAR
jgi:hypothetical protein